MKITEIMYHPVGDESGEFLELWNSSGKAISIANWKIEGLGTDLEDGTHLEFKFPAGTTVAADEVIIVAKDPAVFDAIYGSGPRVFGPYPGNLDSDGEALRLKDAGTGHPATVDYVHYGTKSPWPKLADGYGRSLELFAVEANLDNDIPEHWRDSLLRNGSPGHVHLPGDVDAYYLLGNCNGDAGLDISDALAILLYLFAGYPAPCLDGCDANGNGNVAIDDAIGVLRFLFIADGSPIPGVGECRQLPAGSTCGASNCTP
jgi:hypothetical protein